ncbi:MAG: hypothetical protein QOD68_2999 [Actinomycetota bacterium]|jgi:hypothetical protein|nr:hypothetical protein [Actinomycetota bacterium]
MTEKDLTPLSADEIAAEAGTALPPKEVVSLLDLNVDLDLALDLAAPIDLAVAANANVVAPIDAAVGANVLSVGSTAQSLADQGVLIDQGISGEAVANSTQDSTLDQSNDVPDAGSTVPADGTTAPTDGTTAPTDGGTAGSVTADPSSLLDGDLLNVDVNANLDADIAAPIAGAVAANANVAAPIDAAVSANVGSIDSSATAIASQDAMITQHLDDVTAEANTDQQSDITQ